MVQMADRAGFEIVWAAEHHALEMTIAPNPFHLMTWWADHTEQIRLGCGVANSAYWHPIRLAGEAVTDPWMSFDDIRQLVPAQRIDHGLGGVHRAVHVGLHPDHTLAVHAAYGRVAPGETGPGHAAERNLDTLRSPDTHGLQVSQ